MALNWTMIDESRRYVPLQDERNVMNVDQAELLLIVPGEVGGASNPKRLKENGSIWLTDQRLIFVKTGSGDSLIDTLSVPLLSVLSTSFVQPTFAANYLAIDIRPSVGGGLTEGTKAEIRFKDHPMFGFVSALDKLRERAVFMKRESAYLGEDLPMYSSQAASGANSPRASTIAPVEPPPGYDA
ncbi:hypothetical protein Clacol_001269 [Clathrus columnatus]|uniref:GRAM domain-containing protein n=1 Tax=Clathrus columnatus TaxID=1419009 RepID=A0AAV5A237_9AGAM|nr:hypothetical protein Clacol_001269 [Clathrus columnatus]